MISRLQLLARDADAALSAYEAAEALYQQRKATLEVELKAAEMQVAFAALLLQKDRDNTRAQLHAAAEKEWGPDYASRAPLATYNLRGDPSSWQLPSPPPSPPEDPPPQSPQPPQPPQQPLSPPTPPTGPPRCPVCGTIRQPGESTCLSGGVCTQASDDTISEADGDAPISPAHPHAPTALG